MDTLELQSLVSGNKPVGIIPVLKNALYKLNNLLKDLKIEYTVTGTLALDILGMPIEYVPGDIDVQVQSLNSDQLNELLRLQYLSGFEARKNYSTECLSFYIDRVKINVLLVNRQSFTDCIPVQLFEHESPIYIQNIKQALACKMKLGRQKDYKYLNTLIHNMSAL